MILVDTSVWIDHFREADETLSGLLGSRPILAHSAVVGELALGGVADRAEVLARLGRLPSAVVAQHGEYSL